MSVVHPDRVIAAEAKLAEDPHDLDSWQMLIKNAQCRGIDEARETYERLVDTFPTCGRYWKIYIEQEVRIVVNNIFFEKNYLDSDFRS